MIGPISLSNYPHVHMVSKTSQRFATEFDIMGLLSNFLDWFCYFCIGPVQCVLYINLKLYCRLAVSCFRRRAASFSPEKICLSGITDGQNIIGQVSLQYFGVPCQYDPPYSHFIHTPHTHTHTIHINLAKYNFVTWNTFITELQSSKVMNR
jgi:hypothetical protein